MALSNGPAFPYRVVVSRVNARLLPKRSIGKWRKLGRLIEPLRVSHRRTPAACLAIIASGRRAG